MTELKTLKDLEKDLIENEYISLEGIDILKTEAVKWIKWLESLKGNGDYSDDELEIAKMQYIEFFNLIEEDLK